VAHSSGTSGLSSLSLLAPVVLSNLGCWVSAGRAGMLLDMERSATASSAQRVGLVMSFAKGTRAFCHFGGNSLTITDKLVEVMEVYFRWSRSLNFLIAVCR